MTIFANVLKFILSIEMINRSHIRQKVVQVVYINALDKSQCNILDSLKFLNQSLDSTYSLYKLLLYIPVLVQRYAVKSINHRDKFSPGHVLMKERLFAGNMVVEQLSRNLILADEFGQELPEWIGEGHFIADVYNTIVSSVALENYQANSADLSDDEKYKADKDLLVSLYKECMIDNAAVDTALEEQNIYWNEDKDYVDSFILKTIKGFKKENGQMQQILPMYSEKETDNFEYAENLLTDVIRNFEEYTGMINSHIGTQWEMGRIALFDTAVIATGISEMKTFPEIPVVVTINEYVELAKLYSTPKSSAFVNGILENIRKEFGK